MAEIKQRLELIEQANLSIIETVQTILGKFS